MVFLPPPGPGLAARIALEDDGGSLTYSELIARVEEAARRLRGAGVGAGTVVAVAGELDRDLVVALHAAWGAGGIVAPFHPAWTPAELRRAVSSVEPAMVLLGEGLSSEAADTLRATAPSVLAIPELLDGPAGSPHEPVDPEGRAFQDLGDTAFDPVPSSTPAARLFTSGTEGDPKVVELTVGNLRASATGARERLGLDPSDRWFASLSVAHVGGLALVTRAGLLGCRIVLGGSFDAGRLAAFMKDGRVTHASLVPTMARRLLDVWGPEAPPASLRCLLVGGAGTPGDLLDETLERGFPVALTYGLSEASSQVATAPPDLVRTKPGTVGLPLPGTEIRIASGGAIQVRGGTVSAGQADEAGWLETGDLGRLDHDGHLWIMGRSSNRILTGGLTVDPGEVEAVLARHPSVEDVLVLGVDDPEWGEKVVAVVVAGDPRSDLVKTLDDLARDHLSPGKRPRLFRIVEALPLNPNGKVDRGLIRQWFQ